MSHRPSLSRDSSSYKAGPAVPPVAAPSQISSSPSGSRRNSSASRRASLQGSGNNLNSVVPPAATTSSTSSSRPTSRRNSAALRRLSASGSSSSESSVSVPTSRSSSVSTGTSDSFDNYYPLVRIDDDKRVYCIDSDTNVCFKPGDFVDPDKQILQKLFTKISNITQWSPISRDPPKTDFLTKYQYVYRAGGRPAKLVKRSDTVRYRGYYRDYDIADVRPDGSVDCAISIGYINGQEQFRITNFKLWEFTDVASYSTLQKLARGAELRRDAMYWDEATRINTNAAIGIYNSYDLVRIQGGNVMLVPARA